MVWFGPMLAWLLASSSTAVSCRATVSPLRRLRRNCRAALLHGCTAAPICCAAPAATVTAYCRTAPPHRSVTAPLLPLRYCRDAAPLRYCRACCRHRVAPLRPRRSAAAVLLPPKPLCYCRAAPLHCRVAPLRAAPRHSATCCQLCTAPPRCCRTASLLPRRFAATALEPIAVGLGAFQNMLSIMYSGYMFVATSLLSVYCPLLHRPLRQYGAVRLDSDIMGELKESRAYRHHDSHDSLRRHCHRRRQHRHSHPACSQ